MKGRNKYCKGKAGGNSDIHLYDFKKHKDKYKQSEDLNLSRNDTNTEIVPCIICSCMTWIQYEKLSREAQVALDERKMADLNAHLERFEIHDNITQRRH